MTPGSHPDRPFKIYVPLLTKSFGDILVTVKAAACIAAHFEFSYATFHVHRYRPYVRDIVSLYPFWAAVQTYDDPAELPQIHAFCEDGSTTDPRSLLCQDMILPACLAGPPALWSYPDCPLAIRGGGSETLKQSLMEQGLDPDRWFACVHYREPTYGFKQGRSLRDVDAHPYESVSRHIIQSLGGQVVRLGHPEMPEWPSMPGLIDLSRIPDSWSLQCYAVSRARYFVGSGSGGTAMAGAFSTPSLHTDILDFFTGRPNDLVLTQEVIAQDGKRLMQQALLDAGLMSVYDLARDIGEGQSYRFRLNSEAELIHAVHQIHVETDVTRGWRDAAKPMRRRDNRIQWPPTPNYKLRFARLPNPD